ncbi:MAG TPA: PH domain-containing protein [Xanthobacteraceae bacterium]|nr:PH domain-containing protein [Xanthobacteraceae bacterium]
MLGSMPPPPEVTATLDRGERVIWSGRPRQGLMLRGMDAFVIPFAVVWTSIPAYGAWMTLKGSNSDPVAVLPVLLFIVIGLYMLIGRFFVDAAQRRRTSYALTSQRVLILSGLWSREVRSLAVSTLGEIDVSARASGWGTIMFGRSPYPSMTIPGWPGSRRYVPPMFEMIPDVNDVAKLIRDTQRAAKASERD